MSVWWKKKDLLSDKNPRKKFFCTLGTSGDAKLLLEVIKMLNSKEGMTYSAILLSPPSVCPINKVREMLRNPYVYATDRFVPAKRINELADIVICHGGQGTLQTAIISGTPLIGVATQPEQKINLEHLTQYGAAIRIPIFDWNTKQLSKAVKKIIDNENQFKKSVSDLRKKYLNINVAEEIGTRVWACI